MKKVWTVLLALCCLAGELRAGSPASEAAPAAATNAVLALAEAQLREAAAEQGLAFASVVASQLKAALAAEPEAGGDDEVVPPVPPPQNVRIYVVGEGEDLFAVALLWNVPVGALIRLNGLRGTELTPGQRLRIPVTE